MLLRLVVPSAHLQRPADAQWVQWVVARTVTHGAKIESQNKTSYRTLQGQSGAAYAMHSEALRAAEEAGESRTKRAGLMDKIARLLVRKVRRSGERGRRKRCVIANVHQRRVLWRRRAISRAASSCMSEYCASTSKAIKGHTQMSHSP